MGKIVATALTEQSRFNYNYEMEQAIYGRNMMWSGPVMNKSQYYDVGDFLGWFDWDARTIRAARIANIMHTSVRRVHWSAEGDGPCLILESSYIDIPLDLWLSEAKKLDGKPYKNSHCLTLYTQVLDYPF